MRALKTNESVQDTLIIFIHGIGDSKDTKLFNYFSEKFLEVGIRSYKYDVFEHSTKQEPSFVATPFNDHVYTLDKIIKKQSESYKYIFILGHSFGCLLGLLTNEKVSGFLLLEPSLHPRTMFKSNETLTCMYKNFPEIIDLLKKSDSAKFFIFASNGGGVSMMGRWGLTENKCTVLINDTDHNFSDSKSKKDAFVYCIEFVKKVTLKQ